MFYTVGEMAKLLGIPASTLRYYDKEGLLPFVERSSGGIRLFKESDYEWMKIIECLKMAGMPLKDIKTYIELTLQGDDTIPERLDLFLKQRAILQQQMAELQHTLDVLDFKCWYYETAKKAGTTLIHQNMTAEQIPDKFKNIKHDLQDVPQAPEEPDISA